MNTLRDTCRHGLTPTLLEFVKKTHNWHMLLFAAGSRRSPRIVYQK